MSEKRTTLRLPDKLNKAIEKDYKNQGFPSLNEYIIQALEHFLSCKKASKTKGAEEIRCPIDTTCADCKKRIKFGETVFYHPTTGALCLECGVKRGMTDKARVRKLLALYELKQDKKALKQEIESGIEKLLQVRGQYEKVRLELLNSGELTQMIEQYKRYINATGGSAEEKESFQKMLEYVVKALKVLHERDLVVERYMAEAMKQRKKKKKSKAQNA